MNELKMIYNPIGVIQALDFPKTLDELVKQPEIGVSIENSCNFKDGLIFVKTRVYKLKDKTAFATYINIGGCDSYGNPSLGSTKVVIYSEEQKLLDYFKKVLDELNYRESIARSDI